jgi:hypothetical protein
MFLSVLDIFWCGWNWVGSIFSANGDLMLHVLGHLAFHGPGFADAAAGKYKSAANSDRDAGGLHELTFLDAVNTQSLLGPSRWPP